MAIEKILIVDDETIMRNFLAETLLRKNFEVETASCVKEALGLLKDKHFDLVISDMKMPDGTGLEVLKKAKNINSKTVVIIITAYGSIENTVEAMKLGAFNYLIKPFSPDTIEAVISKAQEHLSLIEENQYLRQAQEALSPQSHHVVAQSARMKKILQDILRVAKSNATCMIVGESGTGKEVISQFIHQNSLRSQNPYIRVNCAAVPDNLIESEFFGHEKGAFTGAHLKRTGRFELAHKGSLLLDEVTEIPLSLQPKLLRVIQEKEFERVGGCKPIKVDVRLIATSNRNIQKAIEENIFREDLYYRLNVIPVELPSLRERKEDIIALSEFFLQKHCLENHKKIKSLSEGAKKKLLDYSWPGNVRELANILERAVVLDYSDKIEKDHLYLEEKKQGPKKREDLQGVDNHFNPRLVGSSLKEIEKHFILETLKTHENNREKTSQSLGISIRTLRNKLNEYKINT